MLTFLYSTVNAGKSANLIMRAHSCQERGIKHLIFVPSIAQERDGEAQVRSRAGFEFKAVSLDDETNPAEVLVESMLTSKAQDVCQVIFVDEAQFLTKKQVLEFAQICDQLEIPVYAYGLRTDFKGEPFEGSKYLLAWADNIEEISTFETGTAKKATFNMKINEKGDPIKSGRPISPGFGYKPVSRKTFNLGS